MKSAKIKGDLLKVYMSDISSTTTILSAGKLCRLMGIEDTASLSIQE